MAALVVGDPLDKTTQIGPVVDESQLDQDEDYIRIGKDEGAELVGGERVQKSTEGFFLAPALFVGATNAMRISREEIFGPVAAVIRVKDYDEALAVANDTDFGLSAGICTTSLKYATHFKRNSRGRHGDGEPADRGRRLPRALRRLQGLVLRLARAGALRRGVLHHGQDRLHRGRLTAMRSALDWRALALGLAFATIWSSAFTSSRIVVEYWPPFLVLSLRFLLSGLLALGIGFAAGQRIRLNRAEWQAVVVFGVCQNALYLGLFHYAMQTIEAGLAAILASALPLCVAGLGRVFLGQRLSPVAIAGLFTGFAGVLVIMTGRLGHGLDWGGVAACITGVTALAVATLTLRNAAAGGNLWIVVGLQMLVGAVALFPASLLLETWEVTTNARFLAALAYSSIVSGRHRHDDLVHPRAPDRRDARRDLPLPQPLPRGADRRRRPRRARHHARPRRRRGHHGRHPRGAARPDRAPVAAGQAAGRARRLEPAAPPPDLACVKLV